MVSLLCIIFIVVTVICFYKATDEDCFDEGLLFTVGSMSAIVSAILLIWVFVLINTVGTANVIDSKIAMYEEENASIEESMDVIVKSYMDFETRTYGELKSEDAINLVTLFPELKSDTLVQKQIEVYLANNATIKALKEEKINLPKAKWKLYFGR